MTLGAHAYTNDKKGDQDPLFGKKGDQDPFIKGGEEQGSDSRPPGSDSESEPRHPRSHANHDPADAALATIGSHALGQDARTL